MRPYYADDAVTIYHGDCREVLPTITADVVVTDPPYGMGWTQWDSYDPAIVGEPKMNRASDRVLDRSHVMVRDAALEIVSALPAIVFGNWRAPMPFGTRWRLIWDKGYTSLGGFGPWRASTEDIYITGTGWIGDPVSQTIIRFSPVPTNGRDHPTPKPIGLMRLLLGWCPPGTILDPFMGSGTTLRAAKDLGRQAIGIEIEERYCEIAAKRMSQSVMDLADMTLTALLIGAFATYRLALLVTEDRIAYPLRKLAGVRRDGDAEIVPDGWLAYLVTCLRCCSVYAALLVAIVLNHDIEGLEWLALPAAYSGGAIVIDAWVRHHR